MLCLSGRDMRIGVTRNLYCDAEALQNIQPPFDGQLMPANITLVERKYLLIQFTKLVDVYDASQNHVGYFYESCLRFKIKSAVSHWCASS